MKGPMRERTMALGAAQEKLSSLSITQTVTLTLTWRWHFSLCHFCLWLQSVTAQRKGKGVCPNYRSKLDRIYNHRKVMDTVWMFPNKSLPFELSLFLIFFHCCFETWHCVLLTLVTFPQRRTSWVRDASIGCWLVYTTWQWQQKIF